MTREEAEQRLLTYRGSKDSGEKYGYRIAKYIGEYKEQHYFECVRSDIENPEPQDYIWLFVARYGAIYRTQRKEIGPISKEEAEQIVQKYLDQKNAKCGGDFQVIKYLGEHFGGQQFHIINKKVKKPTPKDYEYIEVFDTGVLMNLPIYEPICVD